MVIDYESDGRHLGLQEGMSFDLIIFASVIYNTFRSPDLMLHGYAPFSIFMVPLFAPTYVYPLPLMPLFHLFCVISVSSRVASKTRFYYLDNCVL